MTRFTIDLDAVAQMVARMDACVEQLDTMTREIERVTTQVRVEWQGPAAGAYDGAQEEWRQGLTRMRQALTDLSAAGDQARQNHIEAVEANVAMWEQTR